MARQGHVCGAVSGAILAVGLSHGSATPEGKEETYKVAREFIRRFEEKHGTIICCQLIGCDISTPEGLQRARESGVIREVCPQVVHDAADILQTVLEIG